MARSVVKKDLGDGWTSYGPPDHEKLAGRVAAALEAFVRDCRNFARVARDVKLDGLHKEFGLTWEQFCVKELLQPVEVVEAVMAGVHVLGEEIPIPSGIAEKVGRKAIKLAADPTVGPLAEHGGERTEQAYNISLPSTDYGNRAEYLVRRLKRDAPDIAAALGRGEYRSARAAGIAAGIVRVPSLVETICKLWSRCTDEERQEILERISGEAP